MGRGPLRRPLVEELEPRRLYSADVPAALGAAELLPPGPEDSSPALHLESGPSPVAGEPAPPLELVFVDAAVPDFEVLRRALEAPAAEGRRLEVVTLDAGEDGLDQIGRTLAAHRELAAVHVIAHGSEAGLQLGDAWLDAGALAARAQGVTSWSAALAEDADLLLYGCDLAAGAEGRALLDGLAELTGADVAASLDATGHASLGGDWALEYRAGRVESAVALGFAGQAGWLGLLAAPVAADDAYTVDQNETLDSQDGWLDEDWAERRRLGFDNALRSEALGDFPVLVRLDASRIDYAQVQDAGQDLRFVDPDGTPLAHEIERWDESGTSFVWVRVPRIDALSSDDFVWMYYGNASAPDAQDPAAVWSNGFEAVYHLDEDPGAGAGGVVDSTGRLDATNRGSSDATGWIGGAQEFDPLASAHLHLGNELDLVRDAATATLSAWVNADSTLGSHEVVAISRGSGATVQSRAGFFVGNNGSIGVFARTLDDDTDWNWRATTTTPITTGSWHWVTSVIDYANDSIQVFVDGVAQPMGAPASFIGTATQDSDATTAAIGAQDDGGSTFWDGRLDEVRVAEAARSADWVSAQHAAMTDALVSFGTPQTVAGVLANDVDADADPLSAVLVSGPAHASAFVLSPDGTFVYTPETGFRGTDQFTYRADDGGASSHVATVTITVRPIILPGTELIPEPPAPEPPPVEPEPEPDPESAEEPAEAAEPAPSPESRSAEEPLFAPPAAAAKAPVPSVRAEPAPAALRPGAALPAVAAAAPLVRAEAPAEAGPDGRLWEALDAMGREMDRADPGLAVAWGGSAVALTAGVVSWLLRGGYLMGSLLTTLPLWSRLDPLPVVDAAPRREPCDGEEPEGSEADAAERRAAELLDREPATA